MIILRKILYVLVALVTIIGVVFSIWQGIETNKRTDLNIELANRPFVSIEDVYWSRDDVWLGSLVSFINYGNKPAEQFQYRNFRAIIFHVNDDSILNKLKEKEGDNQYLQLHALDEKNRLILKLMDKLVAYFKENPDVTSSNTRPFLNNLLKTDLDLLYKGQPFFNVVEVNNDMDEYYRNQRFLIYPNAGKPRTRYMNEQIGKEGIINVLEGNNILVVYWAIKYRGFLENNEYSTFYLGYSDKNYIASAGSSINFRGIECFPVEEFQSWSIEKTNKNLAYK